jgi:hypothetical protein
VQSGHAKTLAFASQQADIGRLSIPRRPPLPMHDPEFSAALQRYAELRRLAYRRVERLAGEMHVPAPVRLADIDLAALEAWRATWRQRHPLGYGGWNWPGIVERIRSRPSAFRLAIWSGECLCGLAVGRCSKRRTSGTRHTVSVHFLEGNADSRHPLRGFVAPIALATAEAYGAVVGASRLRLVDPLPGVFRIYKRLGFSIARSSATRLYFEKRIVIR